MAERRTAMKRRKWDPKTKAMIGVEGLKGKPVSEICIEHQINQTQYYRWRDQFLAKLPQVLAEDNRREKALYPMYLLELYHLVLSRFDSFRLPDGIGLLSLPFSD